MSGVRGLKVLVKCFSGSRLGCYISVWLSHGCNMASQSEPRSHSKMGKESWKPATLYKEQKFSEKSQQTLASLHCSKL